MHRPGSLKIWVGVSVLGLRSLIYRMKMVKLILRDPFWPPNPTQLKLFIFIAPPILCLLSVGAQSGHPAECLPSHPLQGPSSLTLPDRLPQDFKGLNQSCLKMRLSVSVLENGRLVGLILN